ncbi:hypothetical protein NUW54_g9191 [Trametes sanguinea]|uniref:Uncharacterized protein n=1 Tax=Trametes sanguinea TaxID=158606 RepID=A0ACC1P7U1_9APHY|nr:hypothetical protein NUW54_g9191 [Trametes sanguinea]
MYIIHDYGDTRGFTELSLVSDPLKSRFNIRSEYALSSGYTHKGPDFGLTRGSHRTALHMRHSHSLDALKEAHYCPRRSRIHKTKKSPLSWMYRATKCSCSTAVGEANRRIAAPRSSHNSYNPADGASASALFRPFSHVAVSAPPTASAIMLTLQEAGILSTTFEAILYGYAVFMFSLAMWIMLRDRHERQVNYALVAAGCSLITLATAEMGVNITRVFQGFITKGPFLEGGPEAYFAVVSDPTFVTKSVLYNVQTLILDAVVIYRTYVVWQSGLIVLLPIIGWCGLLAGSIGLNVALVNSEHMGDVFAVQTGRWITAVYALTLGTNLSSTSKPPLTFMA